MTMVLYYRCHTIMVRRKKKIMLYEFHSSFLNVKINKNPTLILKAFCYSIKVEFHSSFLNMKIKKKIQH